VIAGESIFTWISLSFTQRESHKRNIQRNSVTTHDSFLNFGQSQTFDYYSIKEVKKEPIVDKEKSSVFNILYTTNLDQGQYERTIYSLLNLLGDVGGFQSVIWAIGFYLTWFIASDSLK